MLTSSIDNQRNGLETQSTKKINAKSWNIFTVKLQGFKVKRIRPYHECSISNIIALACVSSPLDCVCIKNTNLMMEKYALISYA